MISRRHPVVQKEHSGCESDNLATFLSGPWLSSGSRRGKCGKPTSILHRARYCDLSPVPLRSCLFADQAQAALPAGGPGPCIKVICSSISASSSWSILALQLLVCFTRNTAAVALEFLETRTASSSVSGSPTA